MNDAARPTPADAILSFTEATRASFVLTSLQLHVLPVSLRGRDFCFFPRDPRTESRVPFSLSLRRPTRSPGAVFPAPGLRPGLSAQAQAGGPGPAPGPPEGKRVF